MDDLHSITIDADILALIPKNTALEQSVIPLSLEHDVLTVAVVEGYSRQLITDISFITDKRITAHAFPREEIIEALQRIYDISTIDVQRSSSYTEAEYLQVRDEERKINVSSDGSAVTLATRIITDAIQMHASDIHIEPYERTTRVRYRIDGILHEVMQPPLEKTKPLTSRLKIMADLDIAEKRRPQDGRIRVQDGEKTIDIRVSSLPTDFGEKVVLRILDKSHLQLNLTRLGFENQDLRAFEKIVRLPYGMILVTGPTGSGKTTTLYAALNHINRPEVNITTIEDPIEYNLQGINQTHVRSEIGVTFATALRSILRQDPNIIMVGEIRDKETAEIAIRSALTGHLVFSTLHTNDAPSGITRLIEMGVEPFLIASSVKMILAQRLLRRLCDHCKVPMKPTVEECEELSLVSDDTPIFYASHGCARCNNYGYKGRTAVYEVMPIQNGVSAMIAKGVNASQLREKARQSGMMTLREAALEKARRGETSLEEVIRETV